MLPEPVSVRFSTEPSRRAELARLKLIDDWIVSMPDEPAMASLTVSLLSMTT